MSVATDLFAGPGGWSEGLRLLGHSEVGIELDADACATARAAGHERLQLDVAATDPLEHRRPGVIGSPPCPSFSAAGNGRARDVDHVISCALALADGRDTREACRAACEDERSVLTVEPLRWALAQMPEWIALEQVPAVLPIWEVFAGILRGCGYSVWTGVLEAERYGVPQTRERAILMASRMKTVQPPRATHQRHVFGEPQRHDFTLEGEILPWVSMAEALGWGNADQVGFPRRADDGAATEDGYRARDFRSGSEPAFNLTEKARSTVRIVNNTSTNAAVRDLHEPAPTMFFGARLNTMKWVHERLATTIAGDPRVFQPGGHHANDGRVSNPEDDGRSQNAIRVTVREAAVLQCFRPDYPWQGTRTKQFQQIGNAVPPLLARAILAELL